MLREVIPTLIIGSCLVMPAAAQEAWPISLASKASFLAASPHDFRETVVPISELKLGLGLEARAGTGFCLDPNCRFVATNYHVAAIAQPRKIKGEKVIQRYLATGPDDEGATMNVGFSVESMKYTTDKDLAIFELRRPLAKHHGIPFSLDELEPGQEVNIYAYPKEGLNPLRSLLEFHGTFRGQTPKGLLAFDYSYTDGKAILPGASGGIVVDKKTQQIVGILNSIALNGDAVALAVPVQSLVEFVTKVKPYLAQTIFPTLKAVSPDSSDVYPKFDPPSTDGLQHRSEEPWEVKSLRTKSQELADGMRNFVAVQSFNWGSGDREPAAMASYEIRVTDGVQRYRDYPDGKRELENIPFPKLNNTIIPADDWSELPEMVGTRLSLKINRAEDIVVNNRRMKVFQYRGKVEDDVCRWKTILDFVMFSFSKTAIVDCYGEVWTDEDMNIIRMSEHLELPGKWKDYGIIVTYGWLKIGDEPKKLVPLTMSSQARLGKKIYWCHGDFTHYRVFDSRIRIVAN